jgi:hypothetical protein
VTVVVTLISYHAFEKQFLKLKVFFEYRPVRRPMARVRGPPGRSSGPAS